MSLPTINLAANRKLTLKRNTIGLTFTDALILDGAAVDLTDCTVKLLIKDIATAITIERTAVIVTAAAGLVSYTPVVADMSSSGEKHLEWKVTFSDGSTLMLPEDGYVNLILVDDLSATVDVPATAETYYRVKNGRPQWKFSDGLWRALNPITVNGEPMLGLTEGEAT
jgi:hypothetical protein